jgi:hypothetical protein
LFVIKMSANLGKEERLPLLYLARQKYVRYLARLRSSVNKRKDR